MGNVLTWPTYLPHQKQEISTQKNFLYLLERKQFIAFEEKRKFLTLVPKKQIFQTKIIFYDYRKKQFFNQIKNFLYVKTYFLYLGKKDKALHFRLILNMAMLFFILTKLNRVFNKLIRVLACAKSYIKNFIYFCF